MKLTSRPLKTALRQLGDRFLPQARAMDLSPVLLRFYDDTTEQAYLTFFHENSLFQIRLAAVVGMMTLGMFSIVDVLYSPMPEAAILVGQRVIFGWSLFIAFLGLTYSRYSRKHTQHGLLALVILIGFDVLVMIPIAAKPVGYHYYVGVIITLIFCYSFLRTQFIVAVIAGSVLTISYLVLSILWFHPPQALLVISNMFMVSAHMVGLLASYSLDYYSRREFFLRHKLELANQSIADQSQQIVYEKERVEAIFNNNSDAVILLDNNGELTATNTAFEQHFAGKSNAFRGQKLILLLEDTSVDLVIQTLATVQKSQQAQTIDVVALRCDGTTFDASAAFSPVVTTENGVDGIVCSLRDISIRKQMERRLQQALEHEAEISQLRSRFISMASHDLRNPLAVIQSSIEVLSQYSDRLTEEKKRAKFDQIRASIKIMVDMLNDVLTIGKLNTGRLLFAPEQFDLQNFCRMLVSEANILVEHKQEIAFSCSGACASVMMDQKLVRYIVSNLLSNAIKYSTDNSPIIFDVRCDKHQVILHIQDQGIGIPEAHQQHLFETFRRAGNVGAIPGTGLGLAIVKQSVESHGGTISFESEEGLGTTFTVALPLNSPEK